MHIYLANKVQANLTTSIFKDRNKKNQSIFIRSSKSISPKLTPVDVNQTDQVTVLKEKLNEIFSGNTDGRRVQSHSVRFWDLLFEVTIYVFDLGPALNWNTLTRQCFIRVRDNGPLGILEGMSQLLENGELKLTIIVENLKYLKGNTKKGSCNLSTSSINITEENVIYNSGLSSYVVEKSVPELIGKEDDFSCYVLQVKDGRVRSFASEACITIIAVVPDKFIPDRFSMNKQLLHNQVCSDTTIIAKDGVAVKCHKAFLSVHSSVLGDMIQTAMQETKVGICSLEMPDMSEASVRALLAFLYCGEVAEAENDSRICFELFTTGHKYDIRRLADCMQEILLNMEDDWYDVEVAVKLFLYSRNLPNGNKLKRTAIVVLKSKHPELDNCPAYKAIFTDDPEAAKDLCTSFLMLSLNT